MKREVLWQASVVTIPEAEEAVAEMLASRFAPGPSSYTDIETGQLMVSAYTAERPASVAAVKRRLRSGLESIQACGLRLGPGILTVKKLPARNWAESWKRHFPPLAIGDRLLVKPSWIRQSPKPGQDVIVLDPGLSFGTGQHPTTGFCLRELVRRRDPARAQALLDIGTGSGILAIAAARLGYRPIHAFDHDPRSVLVARANARTNRAADRIQFTRADLTRLSRRGRPRYDVVCANLLADLLLAERDRILARVKPGGLLIAAGILRREFGEVTRAYAEAGWRLVASQTQREWRSGTFQQERRRRAPRTQVTRRARCRRYNR